MGEVNGGRVRCAALVGPYLSGKTTLLEALLHACGAIPRKGSVRDGTTVGDASPEARRRKMTVEVGAADADYLGDRWTFLDCPGSIELAQDTYNACMAADVAVVVCEPDGSRALTIAPLLRFLDEKRIPHMLFINKMDGAQGRVRDILAAYQAVSARPLVLRQVPIRVTANDGGEAVSGYVDLVSERAYRYQPGAASDLIQMPEDVAPREREARQEMLEAMADFDDRLLEQLIEDTTPPTGAIYDYLAKELREDLIVPVLIGAGEADHGVRRLLKALRHDTPDVAATAARRGLPEVEPLLEVFKTIHQPHVGKTLLARVWRGEVREGMVLNGERIGALSRLFGQQQVKAASAPAGSVVALGRVSGLRTGDLLSTAGGLGEAGWAPPPRPVYAMAVHAANRADEVKLTGGLAKLVEEDPSYSVENDPENHQILLWGQGETHLLLAIDRLSGRHHVAVIADRPQTAYRETIRKGTSQHARFKRQTGGHGQFGDVHVDIAPQPRGAGFAFHDKVVGGAVPRNFIPAVEAGVREYLVRGPLGFPVVDVAVTLTDGKHHAVDSSEMAFKTAGRMAMAEGMPDCQPVLLEPIVTVSVHVPNEFTAGVQRLLNGRRGQILGYDARDGWPGWDQVQASLPQSEMHDMIIELRSLTMGIGTFDWHFDRLQELTGRPADDVVRSRQEAAQ